MSDQKQGNVETQTTPFDDFTEYTLFRILHGGDPIFLNFESQCDLVLSELENLINGTDSDGPIQNVSWIEIKLADMKYYDALNARYGKLLESINKPVKPPRLAYQALTSELPLGCLLHVTMHASNSELVIPDSTMTSNGMLFTPIALINNGINCILSGQVPKISEVKVVFKDPFKQFKQALSHTETLLGQADKKLKDVTKLTVLLTSRGWTSYEAIEQLCSKVINFSGHDIHRLEFVLVEGLPFEADVEIVAVV